MKRALVIALVTLSIYIPPILFAGLTDRLILFPTTFRIDAGDAVRKVIPFQGGDLEVWTAESQLVVQQGSADVYVLRFYGNADRAERWVAEEAEMWNGRAVEVWGVNYPGFGGSAGPAKLSRIAPAAVAAFDTLKEKAGSKPIVVFGASIGTAAALHLSANRPLAGVILHNPPPIKQMIMRQFGWWNLWLLAAPLAAQIPPALDNITNAQRSHAPAIFLLADQDEIVAPRFQRLVVDAYAGENRVIRLTGASHNSPIEGAAVAELHRGFEWLLSFKSDRRGRASADKDQSGF